MNIKTKLTIDLGNRSTCGYDCTSGLTFYCKLTDSDSNRTQ